MIRLADYAGSPIEARMADAMQTAFAAPTAHMSMTPLPPMSLEAFEATPRDGAAWLIPQCRVDGDGWHYRLDFLVVCGRTRSTRRMIAVECDGAEWHDRKPDQVKRDRLRDRRLFANGIFTLRFSGSEIHASAAGCAEEIRSEAHAALGDALYQDHLRGRLGK